MALTVRSTPYNFFVALYTAHGTSSEVTAVTGQINVPDDEFDSQAAEMGDKMRNIFSNMTSTELGLTLAAIVVATIYILV